MSDGFKAGQYEITKFDLFNFDRTQRVSLVDVYTDLVISEDLFRNHIVGEVSILDGATLYQNFPILGEEWLELEYISSFRGEQQKRKYKLFVYSVVDYAVNWNTTAASYRLKFCSEEAFKNATKFRSRFFNDTCSNIITKVLKEADYLETSKEISIQETKGVITYTSPKITCFEIIDYLRHRAISTKDKDANMFFFYETHKGFFFKSQEQLIEDAANKLRTNVDYAISNSITFTPTSHLSDHADVEEKVRNLTNLQIGTRIDTFEGLKQGLFNQTTYSYDFANRDYNQKKYTLLEHFKDVRRFDDTVSQTSGMKHSQKFLESLTEETRYNFIIGDSSQQDHEDVITKYSHKAAYIQGLVENAIIATMYGDTAIEIGDILNLELAEVSTNNAAREFDRYLSGNYLVGRQINHFSNNEHTMTLHLYKDAFKQQIRAGTEFSVNR